MRNYAKGRGWLRGLAAIGLGLAACAALAAPGDEPVQRWMQSLHDDWALPRYERLQAQTQDLAAAVARSCGEPAARGPALTAARRAWRDSMHTWRQLEALQLGPTLTRRTSKTIDFWPTRPAVIDKAAQMTAELPVTGAQAEQAMLQWGSAAKGLPALEWLLFPEGGAPAPITRDTGTCRYAQRVALALAGEAAQVHAGWREQAARWHAPQPQPPSQRALSDTLNLFIGSIELLRGKKLAKGADMQARVRAGSSQAGSTKGLDAFDSLRSGTTRQMLWAHADALAQLLLGRTPGLAFTRDAPALGLDDLLAQRGHAAQAAALGPAVRHMRQALRALPADPRQWTPARVRGAAESLAALRRAIDPAVAQALGVTITFTDADGD